MKRLGLFAVLVLGAIGAARAQDDHLVPECTGVYAHYDSIVWAPFGAAPGVRFIAAPSWGCLTAFLLEKEPGAPVLKVRTMNYAGKGGRPSGFYRLPVDTLYGRALEGLVNEALLQVDFPEEDTDGLDGVTYFFSRTDAAGVRKTGKTWSPGDSTLMHRLARLCDSVCLAATVSGLPDRTRLQQLTGALEAYRKKYRSRSKEYKSRGPFDLTYRYYKGRFDRGPHYPTPYGLTEYAVWRICYPDSLLRTNTWGEAVCHFFVDSAGWVSVGNCIASHPLFRKQAERIVRSLEFWEPAQKDGRKVASDGVLFIPFNPEFYRERLARQQPVLTACAGQRVDKEPGFPDDIRSLVMGNRRGQMRASPDTATVTCRFTVNREGYVENARVVAGAYPDYNNEALSILYGFPRLIPASVNGAYVPFDYLLTIHFWEADYRHYRIAWENEERVPKVSRGTYEEYATYGDYPDELMDYVRSHVRITPEMKATGIRGRVVCSFIVRFDGSMDSFEVVRGLHSLFDEEALRVVRSLPNRWSPTRMFNWGKHYLEFAPMKFTVPVHF